MSSFIFFFILTRLTFKTNTECVVWHDRLSNAIQQSARKQDTFAFVFYAYYKTSNQAIGRGEGSKAAAKNGEGEEAPTASSRGYFLLAGMATF